MKVEDWFLLRVMESECCPETSTELNLSCSQMKPCLDSVRELEHLMEMEGGSSVCVCCKLAGFAVHVQRWGKSKLLPSSPPLLNAKCQVQAMGLLSA